MRKKATNLTLSDEIRTRAQAVMAHRGFSSFSAFVEQLIRDEYERQRTTAATPPETLNSAPTSEGSAAFQEILSAAVAAVLAAESSKPIPSQKSNRRPARRKVVK